MSSPEGETKRPEKKIIIVKSSINGIGWNPKYIENLKKLVKNVHNLVSHAYAFIKFIFIQELENNNNFNLEDYAVQGFYKEVFFIPLVEYKRRDGGVTRNTSLSDKLKKFHEILKKYTLAYKENASYTPIQLSNAQQIADYKTTKIDVA